MSHQAYEQKSELRADRRLAIGLGLAVGATIGMFAIEIVMFFAERMTEENILSFAMREYG